MPTPITYLPYSLSLITRLEKSESPDRRMNVPISGRVKTSSSATMARRMSVAFFFADPYAGAKIRSIDDSERGTMYCGYRRQSAYARCTDTLPLTMSEERRFFSSVWRSERMPIVTLSKSMSRAAFGAWDPANAVWDIACGPRYTGAIGCDPRCTGATCRCAPDGADRCDLVLIFLWNFPVRGCVPAMLFLLPRRLHAV